MSLTTFPICKNAEIVCGVKHSLSGVSTRCLTKCTLYEPNFYTNADRIRAMTDEELAAFIAYYDSNTPFCERMETRRWLEWLKREADNG